MKLREKPVADDSRTRSIKGFLDGFGHLDAAGLRQMARSQARQSRRNVGYAMRTPAWRTGARARKAKRGGSLAKTTLYFDQLAALVEARAKKGAKSGKPVRLKDVPFKEVAKIFDEVDAITTSGGV